MQSIIYSFWQVIQVLLVPRWEKNQPNWYNYSKSSHDFDFFKICLPSDDRSLCPKDRKEQRRFCIPKHYSFNNLHLSGGFWLKSWHQWSKFDSSKSYISYPYLLMHGFRNICKNVICNVIKDNVFVCCWVRSRVPPFNTPVPYIVYIYYIHTSIFQESRSWSYSVIRTKYIGFHDRVFLEIWYIPNNIVHYQSPSPQRKKEIHSSVLTTNISIK